MRAHGAARGPVPGLEHRPSWAQAPERSGCRREPALPAPVAWQACPSLLPFPCPTKQYLLVAQQSHGRGPGQAGSEGMLGKGQGKAARRPAPAGARQRVHHPKPRSRAPAAWRRQPRPSRRAAAPRTVHRQLHHTITQLESINRVRCTAWLDDRSAARRVAPERVRRPASEQGWAVPTPLSVAMKFTHTSPCHFASCAVAGASARAGRLRIWPNAGGGVRGDTSQAPNCVARVYADFHRLARSPSWQCGGDNVNVWAEPCPDHPFVTSVSWNKRAKLQSVGHVYGCFVRLIETPRGFELSKTLLQPPPPGCLREHHAAASVQYLVS